MYRRANTINLLVAAATGVVSGVYIFKPILENSSPLTGAPPAQSSPPTNDKDGLRMQTSSESLRPSGAALPSAQSSDAGSKPR